MLRKLLTLTAALVMCGAVGQTTAQANHIDASTRTKAIYTHDFITATRIVGRYYGRDVESWLVNCSGSEGGHGDFVWRSHIPPVRYQSGAMEDKPGGWMQFFKSTWDSNARWAFIDARGRGLKVSFKARSYTEPLGQAIVAGVMYHYHGNPGTWTGYNC